MNYGSARRTMQNLLGGFEMLGEYLDRIDCSVVVIANDAR